MTADAGHLTETQLAVTSAALDGDASAVYHLVTELLGQGVPFERVLFEVVSPVQRALGQRWVDGDYLISEEHVATNTIETVVSLLGGSFEQPDDAPRIVISCVVGEAHVLPGRMLAAHLLSEGFRTVHLGASMPASDLESFLIEDPPDALVLTCTMTGHLPGARESIRAGHAAGVPVIVGGPAFGSNGERATALGADAWAQRLRDVAELLRTWEPDPGAAAAGTVEPAPELAALLGSRPVVIAAAASLLAGGPDGTAYQTESVDLAFDALAAAMTMNENELLFDFAQWMKDFDEAQRGVGPSAARILSALRQAIDESYTDARSRIEAAVERLAAG